MSHRIYNMTFPSVFKALIAKAERKGKTRQDVLDVTSWLTGYDLETIEKFMESTEPIKDSSVAKYALLFLKNKIGLV